MADDPGIHCRQASWLVSLSRERPLEPAEAEALKHHLERCAPCRSFEEQLRFLQEAARRFGGE